MRISPGVTGCGGPDSHGDSATELAEGRFGMRKGNPGRREKLRINNASNLTRNNKEYIPRLLKFVQTLTINGPYALATEPSCRPSQFDSNFS